MAGRGFAHRVEIAAPPPRVWTALCGPALLPQWLAPDASIRPQKDGTFSATVAPGLAREALIDVFEPPRRLRLLYLAPPELPHFDGAVVEDILLEAAGANTVLHLLCSGVPNDAEWNSHLHRLRAGAERLLGRLKGFCEEREMAG